MKINNRTVECLVYFQNRNEQLGWHNEYIGSFVRYARMHRGYWLRFFRTWDTKSWMTLLKR